MQLSLLPSSSVVILICCSLVFGGCAASSPAAAPVEQPVSAEDGQSVVDDDYFDDDDYLDDYSASVVIWDPLEPVNRFWFNFNDIILEYAAKPVSKAYNFVVPETGRKGLKNFFYNLRAPVRFINCLLQGEGQKAGIEFSSFFMNTIFGFGGFVDMASQYKPAGIDTNEDLGQTFGKWGMGEGLYLVWPFLGPSNVRDSLGGVGDYFMGYYTNPITQFGDFNWTVEVGISAVNALNSLGDIIKAYDAFKEIAVDPYSSMRDGITQLRRGNIAK